MSSHHSVRNPTIWVKVSVYVNSVPLLYKGEDYASLGILSQGLQFKILKIACFYLFACQLSGWLWKISGVDFRMAKIRPPAKHAQKCAEKIINRFADIGGRDHAQMPLNTRFQQNKNNWRCPPAVTVQTKHRHKFWYCDVPPTGCGNAGGAGRSSRLKSGSASADIPICSTRCKG